MEAARRLDIKGHNVTLIEGSNQLGGTLRFASLAYEPNERLLDWLKRQVGQSRIDVRLGTLATPESIAALSPEMVIVATGAIRAAPSIPVSDLDTVFSGDVLLPLILGEGSEAPHPIGNTPCRDRGCQYVSIPLVCDNLQKK